MRKIWVVLVAAGVVVATATPAAATSEKDKARAACVITAITWDGSEKATVIQEAAGSPKPFPQLALSKDKSLRKAIGPFVDDPSDNDASRAFGRWCKSHFPKIDEIKYSPFTVPESHEPVPA